MASTFANQKRYQESSGIGRIRTINELFGCAASMADMSALGENWNLEISQQIFRLMPGSEYQPKMPAGGDQAAIVFASFGEPGGGISRPVLLRLVEHMARRALLDDGSCSSPKVCGTPR